MSDTADTAQVIIRPPIAWALAVLAGVALNWLIPLPFVPVMLPAGWLGAMVFVLALVLVAWAIATMTQAGSNVPTKLPTTTIVETGPSNVEWLDLVSTPAAADWDVSFTVERINL